MIAGIIITLLSSQCCHQNFLYVSITTIAISFINTIDGTRGFSVDQLKGNNFRLLHFGKVAGLQRTPHLELPDNHNLHKHYCSAVMSS